MKAFKARQMAANPQYNTVMKQIKKVAGKGKSSINLDDTELREDTISSLLKDGYNVIVFVDKNDNVIHYRIKWENAKKNIPGKLKHHVVEEKETAKEPAKEQAKEANEDVHLGPFHVDKSWD